MVRNLWNEEDARTKTSILEQRVYSSRLLGTDPALVMHGGGNTSAKGEATDLFGRTVKVLFIKGSGWDLSTIEAAGFPAVRLEPLLEIRELTNLSDPEMMNQLRANLLNTSAPDPSVETLLHAFLPHRFIDHTHADAILTLTNQPDGEAVVKKLFAGRIGVVPYVMPGFLLAKECARIYEENPRVEGLLLYRHGLFTFGETARESYDRMISLVNIAEKYIEERVAAAPLKRVAVETGVDKEMVLNQIRALYLAKGFQAILSLDETEDALQFASAPNSESMQQGPLTPDHVIRTKRLPLVAAKENLTLEWNRYIEDYRSYFDRNAARSAQKLQMLDPYPRVWIVPHVGVITVGTLRKEAAIAGDIYRHTRQVISYVQRMSHYEALPEQDIFDVEYWVLEQAKLKRGSQRAPLAGKVALITGGASGIGLGILKMLVDNGAFVVGLDIDDKKFTALQTELKPLTKRGGHAEFIRTDISNRAMVDDAVRKTVRCSGGLDIVVVNAGIFPKSQPLEDISTQDWERSLAINLSGAFFTVAATLPWMKRQGVGGDIVFIGTKNVPAPGKEAAAYSIPKAGQTQLARLCALEGGSFGIRVNTLHPHLIFDTGLWTPELIEKRAKAYGMTTEQYKTNNLLKTELSTEDVARAVLALVSGSFGKTTGAQIPLDGGSDRTL